MARKSAPPPEQLEPELTVTRDEASEKLDDRVSKGRLLLDRQVNDAAGIEQLDGEYDKWNAYNRELLLRLFTTKKLEREYSWAGSSAVVMGGGFEGGPSPRQHLAELKERITAKISCFESIKERLELFPIAAGVSVPNRETPVQKRERTNRAFIVHGHEDAIRETIARFLGRLGVEAVILHEQPTEGRTLVEKLAHYSDVDFAVVLLTADDVGGAKDSASDQKPRARQNVILELGYFVAKLGRANVCALYQSGVEMPTDYLGVGYVPLDPGGGWQLQLARELRAAGFAIDMNKL